MKEELTPQDILEEHFPPGTSLLIVGPPGSGKTILSQELLYYILRKGKSAICIAPKNQTRPIVTENKLFTWDILPYIKKNQLVPVELADAVDPTELNISLTQAIALSSQPLSLVVVDSLTVLMVGMEEKKLMKFTEALKRKLHDQKVSLVLLATPTKETEDFLTKMKSLVTCVIEIKLEERGTLRRYMRIFKFLERKHSSQWFSFDINDSGIQFPITAPVPPSPQIFLPKLALLEEVSTPYLGMERLLERIRKEKLTCTVETTFSFGQGVMLFVEGELLKSLIIGKDGKRSHAPQLLETSIRTKNGLLSLHTLSPDIAHLLLEYMEDQALFRNLSSEQIRYEEIMENLSESEFSGCVSIKGETEQGLIFIEEGKIVEAYFEDEKTLYSKEALSAFAEAASRGNVHIDIYFSPRLKKEPEEKESPLPAQKELELLPEFMPSAGAVVQGVCINVTLKHLQEQNIAEWSSVTYYPRPLQDITISKVENEILRLKTMKDPYLKRPTYRLRRGYRDREWYPAEEYQDIVYACTRMLEFSWAYKNTEQYEEGWGKLSKAYFELGKTVPSSMGIEKKNTKRDWYNAFLREIKRWRDMGSFSELESRKEEKNLILEFKGDLEPPPRRKGMLWGLLEELGLSKFNIHIEGKEYVIAFGQEPG